MSTKKVADLAPGDVILGLPAGPIPVRKVTVARRNGRQIGWRINGGRFAAWTTTMDATVEIADVDPEQSWVVRRTHTVCGSELVGYWNGFSSNANPVDHTTLRFCSEEAAQTAVDGAFRSLTERRHWIPVPRAEAVAAYVERYGRVPA